MNDVENQIYEKHANLCKMLANPTRLKILHELNKKEKSVGELVKKIEKNQSNISQHLAELRKTNLVTSRREGSKKYYKITDSKIMKACNIIKDVLRDQISKERKIIGGNKNG